MHWPLRTADFHLTETDTSGGHRGQESGSCIKGLTRHPCTLQTSTCVCVWLLSSQANEEKNRGMSRHVCLDKPGRLGVHLETTGSLIESWYNMLLGTEYPETVSSQLKQPTVGKDAWFHTYSDQGKPPLNSYYRRAVSLIRTCFLISKVKIRKAK